MDCNSGNGSAEGQNDSRTTPGKERLIRLISLDHPERADKSKRPPSDDAPRQAFEPGVVHVVLKEGLNGRDIAKQLNDWDVHEHGSEDLFRFRNVLRQHDFQHVEASFDFTPIGLPPEEKPPAGRERYLTLYFPDREDTRLIAKKLRDTGVIERAAAAPRIKPPVSPLTEPLVNQTVAGEPFQWYLQRTKADLGWQLKGPMQFYSGRGVVVADIDWGFNRNHQDLAGRIERRYNSMTGTDYVGDDRGHTAYHGTAALALLGAGANGVGMSGFSFEASLWAIQADNGAYTARRPFQNWVLAIDYVRRENTGGRRKVICLEAETAGSCNIESELIINQAIRDAIAAGVVVCVPAGNGNRDAGKDLAGNAFPETGSILVGSTVFDATNNPKSLSSNWGRRVVVSAPGDPENDWSATYRTVGENDAYDHFGGTSGATPKVAGAVALMLEANPNLTHAEVRTILKSTGTPITPVPPNLIGTFLNIEGAIGEALKRAAPTQQIEPPEPPPPVPPEYQEEVVTASPNGNGNVVPCGAKHGKIAASGV